MRLLCPLLIVSLVAAVLAASPAQNRVCGTTAQQNEQASLDNAWLTMVTLFCGRCTIQCKISRQVPFYSVASMNPEWPGSLIADWQSTVRPAFQALNGDNLDPYDYAYAKEIMDTASPWSRLNISPKCVEIYEEYWMFSADGQPNSYILDYYVPYPANFRAPWQQEGIAPVYDNTTFDGMMAELQAACTFFNARIAGDWWTQAYNYVTPRGGFIPDFAVYEQLDNLDYVANVDLDSSLGLSNPMVDGLNMRGFPYTPSQLAALYAQMDATRQCMNQYIDYVVDVALPLAVPVTNDAQWWTLRDNGMRCDVEMAVNTYNMTEERSQYLFDSAINTLATLIPTATAGLTAAIPDYLGWNKTYIHESPTLSVANNVTFVGINPSDVTTPDVYSNSTVWRSFQQHCIQQVHQNWALQFSNGLTSGMTLSIDYRYDAAGGGYTLGYPAGGDPKLGNPGFVGVRPQWARDFVVSVFNHELTHYMQFANVEGSACDECHTRRYSSDYGYYLPDEVGAFWSFGSYSFSSWNAVRVVVEGHATFVEWYIATQVSNWLTPSETAWENAQYTERLLGMLINVGYWTPNGWTSDTECALFYQTHSKQPFPSFNTARNLCAARRVQPMWSGTAMAYANGAIYAQDQFEKARAACGSAFDPRYFASLHYSNGVKSLWVLDKIYTEYIESGCQKSISDRGNCWRNIAPPSVRP